MVPSASRRRDGNWHSAMEHEAQKAGQERLVGGDQHGFTGVFGGQDAVAGGRMLPRAMRS